MLNKIVLFLMLFGSLLAEKNYFYDSNHVRYELCQTKGDKPYNWLFIPGGPGIDSSYLHSLIDKLELQGNVWLVGLLYKTHVRKRLRVL